MVDFYNILMKKLVDILKNIIFILENFILIF